MSITIGLHENMTTVLDVTNVNSTIGYNTTPYDYFRDQNKIFGQTEAAVVTAFMGFLAIFGLIANALTFMVLVRLPRTVFNTFLASLCISDFISALDSPFVIYRSTYGYRYYEISEAMCKIAQAADFWTTIITIQHILLFSVLRFVSVSNPHKFRRFTAFHARITVITIWVETLLVGFVCFVLWPGVAIPPAHSLGGRSCRMKKKWVPMASIYSIYIFPILLYLPMVSVIFVSLALCILIIKKKYEKKESHVLKAHQRTKNIIKKENFALLQLCLIIASFLFGYLPDISYRATAIYMKSIRMPLPKRTEWLFSVTSHCCLRISECLNPIFYNLGSSNMRKATKEFLTGCCHISTTSSQGSTSTKSSATITTPKLPMSTTKF